MGATNLLRLVAACAALHAADADGNFSALGLHGRAEYPESMSLGWGKLVEILDASSLSSNLRTTGLPMPWMHTTTVHMRDGTPLTTNILVPYPTDKRRPTVVCRSPYGPLSSWLALMFTGLGFNALMQDDRGTFSSGGVFDMFRSAAGDGATTLEWLAGQPWSNGKTYSVGISADGMGEIALILEGPPSLKGQWWAWTTGNGHNFVFPNGAYRKDLLENYMKTLNIITHYNAARDRVIPAVHANEAWSANWWYNITDCRAPSPCHYRSVTFPVISTAAWWDIFTQQQIDDWNGIREHSDPSVRDKHVLIVGPFGHCLLGAAGDIEHPGLAKAEVTSLLVSGQLAGEFFDGNVDGPVRSRLGRINLFIMGGFGEHFPRNWWTSLDDWPVFTSLSLYLQNGNSLGSAPPKASGSMAFEYDPSRPTPMLGGGNIPYVVSTWGCGSVDQLSRESRRDVLVFDSEDLVDDVPVVGRLRAKLFVSSSRNDTDFVVTVSDVTPGVFGSGLFKKSMLVRYGAVRMRWRDSDSVMSAPMKQGSVYQIDIDLMTVAYVFPKGHRIRVAVSSAAAPFYNPNFNTGESEVADGRQNPVVARNVVHFSSEYPSSISLPVVNINDIPPNKHFGPLLGVSDNTIQV